MDLPLNLRRKEHRLNACVGASDFVELKNAFKGILKTYYYRNFSKEIKDICILLTYKKTQIKKIVNDLLPVYGGLKFNIVVECTYVKPLSEEFQDKAFKTNNVTVLPSTSVETTIQRLIQTVCTDESKFEGKGSGWTLHSVDGILLRVSRYKPLGGSSFLPLPVKIRRKHAIINPQNLLDNKCFQWAILARYVEGMNKERVNNRYYEITNKLNFEGLSFPTPISQLKKFEKNNPGISVNVYGLNDRQEVFPLRVSDVEEKTQFDLLFITNSKGVSHYCYINNFSRLVRSTKTKKTHQAVFCKRCFQHYQGKNKNLQLKEHTKICKPNKPVRAIMPVNRVDKSDPAVLKFTNFHHKYRIPIVAYCDFECLLLKVNEKTSHFTTVLEKHEPMSFCVYLVYDNNSLPDEILDHLPNEPFLYRGLDAAKHFLDYLIDTANLIGDLLDSYIPMLPLTVEEQQRVNSAEKCETCNREFTMTWPPVRDHDHLTGKLRSILCNSCNLKRQNQKFLPVVIHGSSNYDSHFIVRQLGCDEEKVSVIPNTNEKYISFTKNTIGGIKLRFIDSFRFLQTSLSKLANNLTSEQFLQTKKFFDETEFPLVTRKGVYPYVYTDSWEKLDEQRLPEKSNFYSNLTLEDISDSEYEHAMNVWNTFNCQTLGQYSDLYLRTDVLLLCDVFENFRNITEQNYELDPLYYLTLPSLTFDAMLKFTNVELELLSDYDKYLFIEKAIRGGITSCITRHAEANNPDLGNLYDCNKPHSYLIYIDANNLYGYAMCKPIPQKNFKWVNKNKIANFDVFSVPENSDVGFILEVDIAYPTHIHDDHKDLPFLPENKCPPGSKHSKLLTTLEHKTNYVCHYLNLKQALENGLVLQKIHRILKFNQSSWLKPYIDFNTLKRKETNNEFVKDFYKLMNNSMFGKTIENIRKRKSIELVNSAKRLNKLISKSSFVNRIIYDDNLTAVELSKDILVFNKPIYVGFTVLELSKLHMYDFYYSTFKSFYRDTKVNLMYADTDSLFINVYTHDVYEDFLNSKLSSHFDMSDYSSDHKCFNNHNKKKLGCFKDESVGIPIVEFVGLRPKLYTYRTTNDEYLVKKRKLTLKKAKGISKPVVKHNITFQEYKDCLLQSKKVRKNMVVFRSKKHCVETVNVNKLALSAGDDKRHICTDGISTVPYGHYSLSNSKKI